MFFCKSHAHSLACLQKKNSIEPLILYTVVIIKKKKDVTVILISLILTLTDNVKDIRQLLFN